MNAREIRARRAEADANIQFVDERGQIRPKSALEKKLEVTP